MLRYETLFLTIPEITADEISVIEKQLEKLAQDAKATILSFEKWGKYKLAYPVRKYDYGVYFLVRFEIDNDHKNILLENIKTLFSVKQFDLVMRFTTQKLDPKGTLEYKRPESLEEVPTRDVDTFLKENKMTGLLPRRTAREAVATDASSQSQELMEKTKKPVVSAEVDQEEVAEQAAENQ